MMDKQIEECARTAGLAELYDRYYQSCIRDGDDDILDYDAIIQKFADLVHTINP